ncbi:MAG: hypothetical protein OEY38_22400 [Gammaproteobacteria bacterium]|nr:hypothetical protein [Gammaproteobacteria bacterium]
MTPIPTKCFAMLEQYIAGGFIPGFATKKLATEYAKSISWPVNHIHYFERVWLVAQRSLTDLCGISHIEYTFPTGYELQEGIEVMKTISVKVGKE